MAKARFKMTDKDKGWNQLKAELSKLAHGASYVKAGILGRNATRQVEGDITAAQLAAIHEFGAPSKGIPSRPWIRGAFDANREKYYDTLRRVLPRVYGNREKLEKLLNVLGFQMVSDIKRGVLSGAGIPPPNAPSTMRRKRKGKKGHIRPLVDTGRMIGSVQHEVVLAGRSQGVR